MISKPIRMCANGQTVDLSNKKSRKQWQELLALVGIRQCCIEIPGLGIIEAEGNIRLNKGVKH